MLRCFYRFWSQNRLSNTYGTRPRYYVLCVLHKNKKLPKEQSGPAGRTVLLRPVAHGPARPVLLTARPSPARLPLLKQGPARGPGHGPPGPCRSLIHIPSSSFLSICCRIQPFHHSHPPAPWPDFPSPHFGTSTDAECKISAKQRTSAKQIIDTYFAMPLCSVYQVIMRSSHCSFVSVCCDSTLKIIK